MGKLPDGPKTPQWWQLIHWIANPFTFLDNCAQRYGDIFTIRLNGFDPLIFIGNPQGIQEIFNLDGKQVDAGRSNEIVRPLVGSDSLLLMDGDRHKRERKLLMPPFHGERLPAYGRLISQITAQVAKQWGVGQPFIARTAMQEITLEVILQVVFGLQSGERYQQIKPLLATTLEMTASPLTSSMLFLKFLQQDWGSWSPWGRMVRRRQQVYDLLQAEINERRAKSGYVGNDILSLMMSVRDEKGQPMTDAELKDELMTLLVAGHETTATALAWALYWLHKLPSVKEKLLQELESLGNNLEPMAIAQLPYLTAVCLETLRIYPVVPMTFGRTTKSPLNIMGYQFAADIMLAPCIYLIHHREDLYPEPKQFKPERFLKHQYSPYEYLPFGGGNRRCLGQALAMLEMKLVLGTVLSRYQLALVNDKPVTAKRRGLTLSPAGGVELVMTGRVDSKQVVEAKPVREEAML